MKKVQINTKSTEPHAKHVIMRHFLNSMAPQEAHK